MHSTLLTYVGGVMLHEQVLCQLNNFIAQTTVTLALTSMGAKYPLRHAINIMMCAINCLPGQVSFL